MKIIAGLGNPGAEYAKTRHNVGFMLIDALAAKLGVDDWREKYDAMVLETRIGLEKVLLVKPLTYMNESGRAIGPLLSWYKLEAEDLVVVHDDLDIPVGTIRIRKKGSAGGHNGIKSILSHVGDEHFARVRIGIGRPSPGWTVIHHVLAPFPSEDVPKIREACAENQGGHRLSAFCGGMHRDGGCGHGHEQVQSPQKEKGKKGRNK